MSDGKNENPVTFHGIKDGVGKDVNEITANLSIKKAPAFWSLNDLADGRLHCIDETEFQP